MLEMFLAFSSVCIGFLGLIGFYALLNHFYQWEDEL